MIDVEVLGAGLSTDVPDPAEVRLLCSRAAARLGVADGHVAIEFVDAPTIAERNARYRSRPEPTDVLSFPIDGAEPLAGAPRELGDVVICPEHTADLREAIVHGMLHLLGMDHERDDGEMLELQRELLAQAER
ncbi:MAG TPA: rRNA maturation RNase YbeY [Solirubrobacteraceae bacterium]|nr:rRNA maturation RNase YbeY [Solirubrobacteraceae bacterium]